MLECKICGCKFNAVEERHYISRDNGKSRLAVAFGSEPEEKLYDTFDCPSCGCQIVVQERKRIYIPFVPELQSDSRRKGSQIVVQERKRIYIPCCETCEEDEE